MNGPTRREVFQAAAALAAWELLRPWRGVRAWASDRVTGTLSRETSTFKYFYADPAKAEEFYPFLENVFHLYPAERFHKLLLDATERASADPAIYAKVLEGLPGIKPWLAALTYSIPALSKQKEELRRQACVLLGSERKIDGYLEMGAPARYISALREDIALSGSRFVLHDTEPRYSPLDVVERGGISKFGRYVPLGNYDPVPATAVADESLDLITNYIGFHHCPEKRKPAFIRSLVRTLRKGGRLLLRDHDVTHRNLDILVGLAHDVFNAGLFIPWDETAKQVRNFQSVARIEKELAGYGLRREGPILFQGGDPTRNALMKFVRVA